jgi:hypothetical protein
MVRSASPEPFVQRLVCTVCKTRFDVLYTKDPTLPKVYGVTVPCQKCNHANKVPIDGAAAATGEWSIQWPA